MDPKSYCGMGANVVTVGSVGGINACSGSSTTTASLIVYSSISVSKLYVSGAVSCRTLPLLVLVGISGSNFGFKNTHNCLLTK
jgi:hypothetical protein